MEEILREFKYFKVTSKFLFHSFLKNSNWNKYKTTLLCPIWHIFKITPSKQSQNSLTSLSIYFLNLEEEKDSIFGWVYPSFLAPWKCWDLFVKNWPKDFWKRHYFFIAKSFYKMRILQKIRVQRLRFDRLMNFYVATGFVQNSDKNFKQW